MMNIKQWNDMVDYFDKNRGKKVRITCKDSNSYEGIIDGYGEDEDSNGSSVWAIWTQNMIFLRENVEKIELLD